MKIYEAHKFDMQWNDLRGIEWYANPHKAMDVLTKEADCYVEWKQMSEYHYVGLTNGQHGERLPAYADFYVVYVRDVIE
jgi:hypothetical protein